MENEKILNSIDEAIEDIKEGKMIIVVDDEDRENEGDFICAAQLITPEKVNFMAKFGRGLICVSIPEERCDERQGVSRGDARQAGEVCRVLTGERQPAPSG